ncbi:DUF262 domain-containing protein [Porphyromonas sp. oral taxon 278]|uniref:DUF262 domain-containing protein n=1 Tax=Porphyromonas sp. oral taxon 278 TaxID=712437 RepID=UPI0025F2F942|nr:DUF262 domain-containing protein [Porphyromonas sp. oral taxon 278]
MDINKMIQELRILDNDNVTLFDKGAHYVIPLYQRAYAWEDEEIKQLIDDINDSTGDYYIGSLIVAKIKGQEEQYEVVDGQQRLTTLYLLLHYLASRVGWSGEVGKMLSFGCRPNSNYTLTHIQDLLSDEKSLANGEDKLDHSICNGLKIIQQKFVPEARRGKRGKVGDAIDVDAFVERLKRVILYRIEVPEHTDLNRYFEIMNTRGEQLEQHDILKARLMGDLSAGPEQEFFARVWNACRDMTGYVQMHFAKEEREKIFDGGWNEEPSDDWDDYEECLPMEQGGDKKVPIKSILKPSFSVEVADGMLEDDKIPIRFDSIIGFPYFLLHVLRVFLSVESISMDEEKELGSLLDDKRLLNDFNEVISYGRIGGKRIKYNKRGFARRFILFLLHSRFLFDRFIIKREYAGDDQEGTWSLKELCTSGARSAKKPNYANTRLRYENEREETYKPRNKECLMIQSALRVSYTSPKVMHWITELLVWLFDDKTEIHKLTDKAERIAAEAVKENFLDLGNYKLGVQTPHVVFNYLDYLLWKKDKEKYEDFVFEFRNSVEHWYPQHPSGGTFEAWGERDTFGNLCIISRSVNSKFSNLTPVSKMNSFERMVQRGSLKLRIMGNIIKGCSDQDWRDRACHEHEEEMIRILEENIRKVTEQ